MGYCMVANKHEHCKQPVQNMMLMFMFLNFTPINIVLCTMLRQIVFDMSLWREILMYEVVCVVALRLLLCTFKTESELIAYSFFSEVHPLGFEIYVSYKTIR